MENGEYREVIPDDGELIARGVIATEPTPRDRLARVFAHMAYGILASMLFVTAPLGFYVMSGAARRLESLHPGMRRVGDIALILVPLSIVSLFAMASAIIQEEPDGAVWALLGVSLFVLVFSADLFWKLCGTVAELAEKAGEEATRQNALFRRRIYVYFLIASLVAAQVRVSIADMPVINLAAFVLWVVVTALLWGLMRQAEGIVQHSEAFDYLDEAPDDTAPQPE